MDKNEAAEVMMDSMFRFKVGDVVTFATAPKREAKTSYGFSEDNRSHFGVVTTRWLQQRREAEESALLRAQAKAEREKEKNSGGESNKP